MTMLLAVTIAACVMTSMTSAAALALDATAVLAARNTLVPIASYSCCRDDSWHS